MVLCGVLTQVIGAYVRANHLKQTHNPQDSNVEVGEPAEANRQQVIWLEGYEEGCRALWNFLPPPSVAVARPMLWPWESSGCYESRVYQNRMDGENCEHPVHASLPAFW
jgi:hypothetical protein